MALGGVSGPSGATWNGLGTVGTEKSTKEGWYRDGNGNWVQQQPAAGNKAPGKGGTSLPSNKPLFGSSQAGGSPIDKILKNALGGSGGGGGYAPGSAGVGGGGGGVPAGGGGGGGNVVPPPGTGGAGQVNQNYQQQANPFLTQMLPQYQAYQNQLQGLYNENPADMFAKLRANQSTMRNEQTQQAGQRGGMGMTNAGNWNVNRGEQQQLAQVGEDWKNMSLQNKQAAAGLMGQGLAGASGVAGNIAQNQLGAFQNQIAANRLGLESWLAPQQLEVQKLAAQNSGRSSLLSALYPYLQLQSQL